MTRFMERCPCGNNLYTANKPGELRTVIDGCALETTKNLASRPVANLPFGKDYQSDRTRLTWESAFKTKASFAWAPIASFVEASMLPEPSAAALSNLHGGLAQAVQSDG